MLLDGLRLGGYRSFGEPQTLAPLGMMNLIAGQNNSGKSNILTFIHRHFREVEAAFRRGDRVGSFNFVLDGHKGTDRPFVASVGLTPSDPTIIKAVAALRTNPRFRDTDNPLAAAFENDYGQWFIDVTAPNLDGAITISEEAIAANAGLFGRDLWQALWTALTGSTGGDLTAHWVPQTLRQLVFSSSFPKTELIPAIRRIGDPGGGHDFSGSGIIDRLAQLQDPPIGSEADRSRFDSINEFVQEVAGMPGAKLNVPYARDMILVRDADKVLPLTSLGTGIHEVVILAVAATVLTDQIVCIEEPELHLHPVLQRQLVRYLLKETNNQYFITTHSAHLLDTAEARAFHVSHIDGQSKIEVVGTLLGRSALAADLGFRASDIVQANCVLWVEGPTDRLYLRHWLAEVAPELREAIDYSVMFFGGGLMSHLTGSYLDEHVEDLISLVHLNRSSFILMDSDKDDSGTPLNETKNRLVQELPEASWVTAGREIENYLPATMLAAAIREVHPGAVPAVTGADPFEQSLAYTNKKGDPREADKIKIAHAVCRQSPVLDPLDLRDRVTRLAEFIRTANGS